MTDDVVLKVSNLSKSYQIYNLPQDRLKQSIYPRLQRLVRKQPKQYFREFWALKDVSFELKRGEALGIIGRNGSGKSTILQIIAGTLTPTCGTVEATGKIAALLELGSGFNPEFTGRENAYMNGMILGFSKSEMDGKIDKIVEFADIGEFIDQPVKTYSSGMYVRLAFAVQAHIDASIVIIDEALAVGDVFFRQKCYARLQQLKHSGASILLVSHSMPDIEQHCNRALVLNCGAPYFIGTAAEATKHYYLLHQLTHNKTERPETILADEQAGQTMIDIPSDAALLDLSGKSQVSNGQARCVGLALCNTDGEPCNSFRQGDRAIFYCKYELNEHIGVPICGILIKDERGIIVHGKNSWQYEDDVPLSLGAGSYVICRQEVTLNLALGEYTFEVGLAAVSEMEWQNRRSISHEEWASRYSTVCVVTNAGQFSVGYAMKNGVAVLTHHGVADLPGKIITKVLK